MREILIYSSFRSERLFYITNILFHKLLGGQVELTTNLEYFQYAKVAKLNYSARKLETKAIWMIPHPLLQERKIVAQNIIVRYENSIPFFFNTAHETDVTSDLFAASFYLLTRYEEYLAYEADEHGRFPAHQSLAYKAGFLERPIVQEWAIYLSRKLQQLFPELEVNLPPYRFQPTFDIDVAWAYRHRIWQRQLGAIGRELLQVNFRALAERTKTLLGLQNDPFDVYEHIINVHKDSEQSPIFFFLLGDYGAYDKNIAPKHPKLQTLIQNLSQNFPIGIHPSYASNGHPSQIRQEIQRLASITGQKVLKSRQHYLKLHLPQTYRHLLECGIQEDYSMGYADAIGFRAGVACAFHWYDLEKEEQTQLKIHPFQIMDVTLKTYMNLSPSEAAQKIKQCIELLQRFGGDFVPLWHNSSFSHIGAWQAWKKVYIDMINQACSI